MYPPEGSGISDSMVCHVIRSLYGLKQSSRCWNTKFTDFMLSRNFQQTAADKCVFFKKIGDSLVIVVLFVDDGLVFSPEKEKVDDFIQDLQATFEITVNKPRTFIGIEIEHEVNQRIFINQKSYIEKLIKRFGQEEAVAVSVPADPHVILSKPDEIERNDNIPYQEAVGSLMFAALLTRYDIMFATNYVSRYTSQYEIPHWNAVKRILRYLKGTADLGIEYRKGKVKSLTGYSDADYAKDLETRRSTTGYLFLLNGGPVSWSTQKQKSVSLSTTEAEYVAASEAAKEATWIRQFLSDIGKPIIQPTPLLIDNQGAVCLIRNPVYHKRTEHIDVKYHHIREKEEYEVIKVQFVSTVDQLADIFTKPLPRDRFKMLVSKIGMIEDAA